MDNILAQTLDILAMFGEDMRKLDRAAFRARVRLGDRR
jgi:hypothetical protein